MIPALLTEALEARLQYETWRAGAHAAADPLIAAVTSLVEAQGWLQERAGRSHVRRRRLAHARALRVVLTRAARVHELSGVFERCVDAAEDAARRYVRELAAARDAERDFRSALTARAEQASW